MPDVTFSEQPEPLQSASDNTQKHTSHLKCNARHLMHSCSWCLMFVWKTPGVIYLNVMYSTESTLIGENFLYEKKDCCEKGK